jgi:hypothetical protein
MSKLIVNVETNEIVERELNKAEKDQQKIDEANVTARKQAELAEEATRLHRKIWLLLIACYAILPRLLTLA